MTKKSKRELKKKYRILEFPQLGDDRGNLVVLEGESQVPFRIMRIFYMYGTKPGVERGMHANIRSEFILINLAGTCKIKVDDGVNQEIVTLYKAHQGIYLEKMVWKTMYDFSSESILLVLSNERYDPNEYIRDYKLFQKMITKTNE